MTSVMNELVGRFAERLQSLELMVTCAESCTGGWLAKELTDIPGCSHWFERGFVTYSNEAKQSMLGVRAETLACHGAVSESTVLEMARGALSNSNASLAVAISGIAGPGGGTEDKPVGTVWIAWMREGSEPFAKVYCFPGDRNSVREQAVIAALEGLIALTE